MLKVSDNKGLRHSLQINFFSLVTVKDVVEKNSL